MARVLIVPAMQEVLLDRSDAGTSRPLHELLSNRELQVFKLIGRGMGPKHIGAEVGCSPNTATSYRRRILVKLHLENDAQLVRYVVKNLPA